MNDQPNLHQIKDLNNPDYFHKDEFPYKSAPISKTANLNFLFQMVRKQTEYTVNLNVIIVNYPMYVIKYDVKNY